MRMSSRQIGLTALLASLVVGSACHKEPPPAYLRISGAAPAIADAPSTRAHLVVFWAAWCPPCREETPGLLSLAEDPPDGLSLVLFSADPRLGDTAPLLGDPPAPGLHARLDPGSRTAQEFGVDTLPTSLLLVDGRLVARFNGPRRWDSSAMRSLLERLIEEQRAPPGSDVD